MMRIEKMPSEKNSRHSSNSCAASPDFGSCLEVLDEEETRMNFQLQKLNLIAIRWQNWFQKKG